MNEMNSTKDTKPLLPTYSISQLAAEFSVTPRAIRFYEDKGLLSPSRAGQTRIYAPRDRVRLMLILQGKRVGFTLSEIREMLDLYDVKDGQRTQLQVSLKKFRERIESLKRQKEDIDQSIAGLTQSIETVQAMLDERARQGEVMQERVSDSLLATD